VRADIRDLKDGGTPRGRQNMCARTRKRGARQGKGGTSSSHFWMEGVWESQNLELEFRKSKALTGRSTCGSLNFCLSRSTEDGRGSVTGKKRGGTGKGRNISDPTLGSPSFRAPQSEDTKRVPDADRIKARAPQQLSQTLLTI